MTALYPCWGKGKGYRKEVSVLTHFVCVIKVMLGKKLNGPGKKT